MCVYLMLLRCLVIIPQLITHLPAQPASPSILVWDKLDYLFVFGISLPPKTGFRALVLTDNATGTSWSVFSVSTCMVSESKINQTSVVEIMVEHGIPAFGKWPQAQNVRADEIDR